MKFARFLVFPVWLALASGAARAQQPDVVFLLIGQSNMAGRAAIEAEDEGEIPGTMLWNIGEKKWEPARAPFNRHSPYHKGMAMQRLNPGPTFAKAWLAANPGRTVGIVCAVRGGTHIEDWEKGRKMPWPLYDTAVAATREALAAGKATLGGILWHQGEANAKEAAAYPAKLRQLVDGLRADFGNPALPFVCGQIGGWVPEFADFNAMLAGQPKAIPHSACVMSDGLTAMDAVHFDSKSQRELGRRYAAALLSIAPARP